MATFDEMRSLDVRGAFRRVLGAVLSVSAAGVLVKLTATAKEVVVAGLYGRSDAMDAFLAALLIPGLLVNLIAESMNQALIPTLVQVRELQGREPAQRLLSSAMLWMCALLAAVSVAMALGAHLFFPLIASHFAPPKLELSIRLFYGLLPVVLIAGIAANCTSVLNTLDRFAAPALAPIVSPAVVLVGALLLHGRLGIWAMVWSTVVGFLLQAAIVAGMMERHGYRFSLRWYGMSQATREVGRQYWPLLLSSAVASGGLLVDQAMAAMLPAGSVSALVYAGRFVTVAIALLGGALATALTPHFSRLIAHARWRECRRALRTWAGLAAAASLPLAVLMIAGSHWMVRIAFQRGAFRQADTEVVARVMAMFALQIPFFIVSRVYYRFLIAMRRTDLSLYCGMLNLALDVILNLVLMRWMGVAGIALATSLWTVSTLVFFGYWSHKLLAEKLSPAA